MRMYLVEQMCVCVSENMSVNDSTVKMNFFFLIVNKMSK